MSPIINLVSTSVPNPYGFKRISVLAFYGSEGTMLCLCDGDLMSFGPGDRDTILHGDEAGHEYYVPLCVPQEPVHRAPVDPLDEDMLDPRLDLYTERDLSAMH